MPVVVTILLPRLLPASASGRRPRAKATLPAGAGVMELEPQADWQLAGQLTVLKYPRGLPQKNSTSDSESTFSCVVLTRLG